MADEITSSPDVVPFWALGARSEAYESNSAWDVFYVNGDPLPGIAIVQGARQSRIDERNAAGQDGSILTELGRTSSEIMVRLQIWTQEHLAAWRRIAPQFQPTPGVAPTNLIDVYHPALALIGVKSLLCTDTGVFQPTRVWGIMETQIRFIEFLPPTKGKVNTPTAVGYSSPKSLGGAQAYPSGKGTPSKGEAGP